LETFGLIASHVECRLHSGRTHQIRVHMAHEQHWLIGDPLYGRPSAARFLKLQKVEEKTAQALLSFPRQALHASDIAFVHPRSKKKLEFSVNLPNDLTNLLKNLKKNVQ
jgi:23S rRNA pseudouridine1911/1915/1917 synthase